MATLTAIYTGESAGGTVQDGSGNGHHAANIGVTQLLAAGFPVAGAALQFDSAADSHFDVPASVIPATGDDFTIAIFFRHQALDGSYLFGADGNTAWSCHIRQSTGYVNMYIGGAMIRGYPPTLSNNSDHLLVIQRSAGFLDFYVDDMANRVSGGYTWDAVTPPVDPLSIGMHPVYPGQSFNSVMDEVQFWAGGLSVAERQSLATTPSLDIGAYSGGGAAAPAVAESYQVAGYFRLTLTGGANGVSDMVLGMTSLNARLKSGAPSYLQATIPCTTAYAEAVAARGLGDLVLDYVIRDSEGLETVSTVTTVALETIQLSKGVNSRSINLVGHRQSTNSDPTSHTVYGLSQQTGTTSKTVLVPGYNPLILPADTITSEGIIFVIGSVILQASINAGAINIQTQFVEG